MTLITSDICPTFLNTEPKDKTFQQSGKQDSFRHISNTSASMYESSGSHFFRNTTGAQSGADVLTNQGLISVMNFLTSLAVEILCSFRLVLEEKVNKKIPEQSR